MREIKFRAWDKKEKRMFFVNDIDGLLQNTCYTNKHGSIKCREDEAELMQFTELHDKNGKEVYEGDILKTFVYDDSSILHVVKYGKMPLDREIYSYIGVGFKLIKYKITTYYSLMGYYVADEFMASDVKNSEVIGNIYENPELLKLPED